MTTAVSEHFEELAEPAPRAPSFWRSWLSGYGVPSGFAAAQSHTPAPRWGLYAQGLRALMDSLLLYLPVALLGRTPPEPSYLPVFSTEHYYAALIFLTPVVLFTQLLISAAVIHVGLRLSGRQSDFDRVLNLCGFVALVIGAFLVAWDWGSFAAGLANQWFLGVTHLIVDVWAVVLTVAGLKRLFSVPRALGALLAVLGIAAAFPLAVVFMRSPF